jgi:hypothetical protein
MSGIDPSSGLTIMQAVQLVSTGGAMVCLVYFFRMLQGRKLGWWYQIEERDKRIEELKVEKLQVEQRCDKLEQLLFRNLDANERTTRAQERTVDVVESVLPRR